MTTDIPPPMPRTEAVVSKSVEAEDGAYLTEDLHIHSRQLERELAASNAALDQMTEDAVNLKAEVERMKGIKQIKVSKRPYDYECGDGCCSEYGETWSVDGVEVAHGPCDDNRLQQLLKHLGYSARIVNENEDGEEVCEL